MYREELQQAFLSIVPRIREETYLLTAQRLLPGSLVHLVTASGAVTRDTAQPDSAADFSIFEKNLNTARKYIGFPDQKSLVLPLISKRLTTAAVP